MLVHIHIGVVLVVKVHQLPLTPLKVTENRLQNTQKKKEKYDVSFVSPTNPDPILHLNGTYTTATTTSKTTTYDRTEPIRFVSRTQ